MDNVDGEPLWFAPRPTETPGVDMRGCRAGPDTGPSGMIVRNGPALAPRAILAVEASRIPNGQRSAEGWRVQAVVARTAEIPISSTPFVTCQAVIEKSLRVE